jgi:DNA-binding IclR family transcriptional regulator
VDSVSGVGVLDKAMAVLAAVEDAPRSLAELVDETGLSRATAHRLARALEVHGLVRRTPDGRFAVGPRLDAVALPELARPALEALSHATGESVQLFVRRGDRRLCIAALESPNELRTIVPVGAWLPLDRGSAGKVLSGDEAALRRGWAESVAEREPGVASVSAPIVDTEGRVRAAVSVSGPIQRTTRAPGRRYAKAVMRAAREIEDALAGVT